MPVVLICATSSLAGELGDTLLWRADMQRHEATRLEQALTLAVAAKPDMIAIDRLFPRAVDLVGGLRREPTTRRCSVVLLARGDFDTSEIELLEAGANAILRLPPGKDWDVRLDRLLNVPVRREARFTVEFALEGLQAGGPMAGQALNLSAHGLLLQSVSPLAVGDFLTFSFRIPGASIDGRGLVMRQGATGQYGILFDHLERDGREQIQRYIGSLS